ncbi:hypothetical protein [Bradyrhizobium elkanii]|uniref:hypothetical protein n=1 Tax=Bradyrhizobium elkanii TaxID=29448 RepID=UPI00155AA54A|nr:hypothetical protein [Bradyrhizobium elkanii]MCS3577762.1 hypothetical protein [Bradyrhizobium elkanii]MCS3720637.1 hypothetical protein [Bradyrhizobium elkanii]MCS4005054.1 hypothetical protein [Bradyrhizobium elkanii USDA 61]MCW2130320.1 hypothetical protein [Bradyrhizobium elkanii]MCW2167996.1 hypothetical protein [Bradyrhizobium elkanii]
MTNYPAAEDVGERPRVVRPSVNELAEVLVDTRLTAQQKLQRRFALLSALMEKKA